MKAISTLLAASISLAFAHTTFAADSIGAKIGSAKGQSLSSRSVADAHAGMMRDWNGASTTDAEAPARQPKQIRARGSARAHADLIRDWDGRLTKQRAERARLQGLYGDRAQFVMQPNAPSGLKIRLAIPIEPATQ